MAQPSANSTAKTQFGKENSKEFNNQKPQISTEDDGAKFPFFRTLWKYIRPYKNWMYVAFLLMLVTNIINLLIPLQAASILNLFSSESNSAVSIPGMGPDQMKSPFSDTLSIAIWALVIMFLVQAIATYIRGWVNGRFGEGFVKDLRIAIQKHLLRLPIQFFDKSKAGDIASRVTNDVTSIRNMATQNLMRIAGGVIELVGSAILMFNIHPMLALVSFSCLPVMVIASRVFGTRIRKSSKMLQEKIGLMSGRVTETSSSMRVVRAFGNLNYEEKAFRKEAEDSFKYAIKNTLSTAAFFSWITIAVNLTLMLILGTGFYLLSNNELAAGEFLAFIMYAVRIMIPLSTLANIYPELQQAKAAAIRIHEIMEIKEDEDHEHGEPVPLNAPAKLEAKNLTFSYGENQVLKNINLTIEAGTTLALVGPSGSGKTTLSGIFIKLFSPTEGEVLIDGKNYQIINTHSFRQITAYVPQDPVLYDGTIIENVRYGKLEATDSEVMSALEAANALEFVEHLENGVNTIVGERGVRLSGGERQRIAIARALLRNPRILLLDEATSSLDNVSERKVQIAIERLLAGRTAIIVAHRLSTIQNADVICVLSNGEIKEIGNHESLIKSDGTYAKLYAAQQRAEELRNVEGLNLLEAK